MDAEMRAAVIVWCARDGGRMTKRRRKLWVSLVSFAFLACGPSAESDPLRGEWLVDFGTSKGVLGFKNNRVSAACYKGSPAVGTYTLDADVLTLLLDFNSSGQPRDFSGRLERASDPAASGRQPFRVAMIADFADSTLSFEPYEGDCSEFAAAR
jgi:hypothetical protein